METWFELWDSENASLVGEFETCSSALRVVRTIAASAGDQSMITLVLTRETTTEEDPALIASGNELLELALAASVAPFAGVATQVTILGARLIGQPGNSWSTVIAGNQIGMHPAAPDESAFQWLTS